VNSDQQTHLLKIKRYIPVSLALLNKSSQGYEASLAVLWDHTILRATRHKWIGPAYSAHCDLGISATPANTTSYKPTYHSL